MFYYVHYQFIATLQKYNWFFLVYWLLSCNFAELIYQLNRKFTFLAFFFFMGHTSLILWISCNLFCCCWKLVVLDNVANVSSYSLLLGIVLLLLACFLLITWIGYFSNVYFFTCDAVVVTLQKVHSWAFT